MSTSYPFVESRIADLLNSPGFAKLSSTEKEAMAEKLRAHAEKMILETFINRLDDTQVKEMQDLVQNPGVLEQKFEKYAADIPGLAEDIEARLDREFTMMKSLA